MAFYDNGSLISSCSHKVLSSGSATCRVTYASAGPTPSRELLDELKANGRGQ